MTPPEKPDLSGVRSGYDRWSEVYDHDLNPLVALEEPVVRDALGDVSGLAVLDLGCGTGRHALWLAAAGARVSAVDFSEGMLAEARRKPGASAVRFQVHDLHQPLPFDASSFDRVVSGLSGETPARLRRRILLERAAFRLVTTRATVLEVALEAGYASNEAFTRAFRRAYGAAPATWRASPARIQLDTPNGVHFHPPGGLRLPARDEVSSMDLMRKMVEHHVWLVGEILDRAERLTEEQLDAPIELSVEGVDDDPTLRSILSRLVGQMDMWNAAMESRAYDFGVEKVEIDDLTIWRLRVVEPPGEGTAE